MKYAIRFLINGNKDWSFGIENGEIKVFDTEKEAQELADNLQSLFPDTHIYEVIEANTNNKKIYTKTEVDKMKHTVRITQTLEGFAEIEADNREEALKIAFERFVTQGEELPDMDDTCQLQFDLVEYNKEETA